nr:hypothetical protein [Tanacetum cinerariifolium]
MNTSMSFSEFGTIAGHKTANSRNLQISFKPADEANSALCTFEIERLAAHKLFVATFSYYESFSWSGVPIEDSSYLLDGEPDIHNNHLHSRNPDASKNNLVVMSYLLSLKFSNLGRAEVEEDDWERARFRDGKISSGRKKSRGSNIGDSDNTGDEGKTVGGAIGACGEI